MKKILIIVTIFYIAYSQSEDATLTYTRMDLLSLNNLLPGLSQQEIVMSHGETCQVAFIEIHLF